MGLDGGGLEELGGVELELALSDRQHVVESGDLFLEALQHGQDGNLGFRWDGVPEWFRHRRLRLHANNTTE